MCHTGAALSVNVHVRKTYRQNTLYMKNTEKKHESLDLYQLYKNKTSPGRRSRLLHGSTTYSLWRIVVHHFLVGTGSNTHLGLGQHQCSVCSCYTCSSYLTNIRAVPCEVFIVSQGGIGTVKQRAHISLREGSNPRFCCRDLFPLQLRRLWGRNLTT